MVSVSRARSASSIDGSSTCCGTCGIDAPSRHVDNFQTYQDGESLDIYGYTASTSVAPKAFNYSGSLMGINVNTGAHPSTPKAAARAYGFDHSRFSKVSFQCEVGDMSTAAAPKIFLNGGSATLCEIGLGTTTVVFDGVTSVVHTATAGDVYKIEATIDAVTGNETLREIDLTVKGYINGVEEYSTTKTITASDANWCNGGYGTSEQFLLGGNFVTDKWLFETTPV